MKGYILNNVKMKLEEIKERGYTDVEISMDRMKNSPVISTANGKFIFSIDLHTGKIIYSKQTGTLTAADMRELSRILFTLAIPPSWSANDD